MYQLNYDFFMVSLYPGECILRDPDMLYKCPDIFFFFSICFGLSSYGKKKKKKVILKKTHVYHYVTKSCFN